MTDVRDKIFIHLLSKPNTKALDLVCLYPGATVLSALAAKHAFFTGDASDAQELECTDEEYRAGYKLYRNESISAGAPWANGWERET